MKRIPIPALALAAAFAGAAGCTTSAPVLPATPPASAVHAKRWGYASSPDTAGPAEWGTLPGDAACRTGTRQSPIALGTKMPFPIDPRPAPKLVFRYGTTGVHLVNDGRTVRADVDKGSVLEIDGVARPLVQLHFHAPSEHSLDGFLYPMEMHLVHAGPDGRPALVVAVFLAQGGDGPAFSPLLSSLPKEPGGRREDPAAAVDLSRLLPAERGYVAYDGSLTTPPCTEGIRWIVLRSPGGLSGAQMGAFVSLPGMTPTNRPLQPLAGRTVQLDAAP